MMKKLSKLHKRRTKYAHLITGLQKKSHEEKEKNNKSRIIQQQQERIDRLGVCTQLLDNRSRLSTAVRLQPLPELPPVKIEEKFYDNNNFDSSDEFGSFIRKASPQNLTNYFNENGIPRLLNYCGDPYFRNKFFDINVDGVVEFLPSILATISGQNRTTILQRILDVHRESAQLTQAFESMALSTDPIEIINQIEHVASSLLKCKRTKFLIASPLMCELAYIHCGIKRIIPMTTGLISSVVGRGDYAIIQDPFNTEEIDLAVESFIFEGSRNCLIAPLMHSDFENPFAFVAIDKLRDDSFSPNDFIMLCYLFRNVTSQIKLLVRELTSATEKDMTELVQGLSEIANSSNAHDMISKIINESNRLTDASTSRLFTVVGDCFCEETPGTNIGGKLLMIDRGLTCRAAINNETTNYFLPRRIKEFSVAIDDLTEPRIWSMIACPATYKGEVKGAFVLYNRRNGTFFSAKDSFVATSLGKCFLPLLHTCCESTKLHESLERNSINCVRAYNLTVFSLKAIQAAGTPNLYEQMSIFCEKLKPSVQFRFLIYENDNLYEASTRQTVQSEPQLLDAIVEMKPTAAINENVGILVYPIKSNTNNQVYMFEFRAPLMKLKTEEESNGILQCTRILHSLEENSMKLALPENSRKMQSKARNTSSSKTQSSSSSSSSSFFNLDLSLVGNGNNMPFIPLSLKNIHDDDGMTSTSIFDLSRSETQTKSDKFIIVSSAQPSINPQSFETQLDQGKLQIYPFDPFLSNILFSFSKLSTRQVGLHNKIVTQKRYKPTVRALHLLGNVLACPMPFSELLNILLISFTNLFGREISLEIFDPPLKDETETDPSALNLERDRKIYASIKIPSPMSQDRSMALSYFADLVLALLASRTEGKPDNQYEIGRPPILKPDLTYNFLRFGIQENVSLCSELFFAFKVHEVLDVTKERITIWINKLSTNPEEERFFISALDALQFGYSMFSEFKLFDYFNSSELCACCLSIFFRSAFPHMRPNFKYGNYLKNFLNSKSDNKIVVRVTTAMILLSSPDCDLLEYAPEAIMCGLIELMLKRATESTSLLIAKLSVESKKGIDLKKERIRALFATLVTEMSQSSPFFRNIDVFNDFCLASMETQSLILYKAEKIVQKYVNLLKLLGEGSNTFEKAFSDKIPWLVSKGEEYFMQQAAEEEEQGNMSLFDAR